MEEIKLPYVRMIYREPIVNLVFNDSEIGIPEIKEMNAFSEKLSGYNPYVVLSEIGKNVNITNEGKKLASKSEEHPLCRGSAIVVDSGLKRLAANFLLSFRPNAYPIQVFTSKDKAIEWLLKIPLQHKLNLPSEGA